MHGATIFFSFWWLIFPIMGFASYGVRLYFAHRQSQQAMEILKTYAAQGKDPPPEVMAAVTGLQAGAYGAGPYNGPGPYSSGPYNSGPYNAGPYGAGGWGGPWGGWGMGRWGWRGPLWAWSRVVTFAAIAIGFAFAGQFWGNADPDAVKAFDLVAIIMGVLAVGFGVMALMHTLFSRNAPRP